MRENRRLLVEIRLIHAESRRTYGSPRVHAALQAQGQPVSAHRVARLMRAGAIRAQTVKRWRATTDSAHAHPVAPHTLNRQFAVPTPNRVWAGDIPLSRCLVWRRVVHGFPTRGRRTVIVLQHSVRCRGLP